MEIRRTIRGLPLEDGASVLILVFFGMAGAIPGVAPNQSTEMTGGSPSALMFAVGVGSQVMVNAAIVLIALRHGQLLRRGLHAMQWAGVLALFAVVSTAWSQDPILTARRGTPFALAGVFGLYLASRGSLRRQLAVFEAAFLILALGSAVLAVGFPALGLDASTGHMGNWQGVFTQKNACGRAMVFATAVVLARGKPDLRRLGSLAIFLAVLAMSGSRGAWVFEGLLVAVLGAYALVAHFGRRNRILLTGLGLAAAGGVAGAAAVNFPVLSRLLGRDPTLTGRTAIWAQVWIAILNRPWLGYGFSAFWRGTKGASFEVVVALKFVLFHAHNGFLEVWLELGAAGLLIFALSYLRGWRRLWPQAFSKGARPDFAACAWPLSILLLIGLYDFDENTLLSFNGLFWILYVHALVTTERGTRGLEVAMRMAPAWSYRSTQAPANALAACSLWSSAPYTAVPREAPPAGTGRSPWF